MDYKRLERLLRRCNGNITETARRMGLPRETVRYHVFKLRESTGAQEVEEGTIPLGRGRTVDLVISDLQLPFHHPDSFDFLAAIRAEFCPTRILNVGDLIDSLGFSFHERDPESPSVNDEMAQTVDAVAALSELFPEMYIAEGNHDMRIYRKAAAAGIPRHCIRTLNSLIGAPKGWVWAPKWLVPFSNGEEAVLVHQCGHRDATKGVTAYGKSIIQGHFATESSIKYVSTRDKLMFGLTTGCLIDDDAIAFAYNKLDMKRPILSAAVIVNGCPQLIPMVLNRGGRWIKAL